MSGEVLVVLGLGSNMCDREGHLRKAIKEVSQFISGVKCSAVYESPALLPENAPPEWDIPFLNIALCGMTGFEPRALLGRVKEAEQKLGRVSRGHWGPREIDIDILAYGDHVVAEPELTIPHRDLLVRGFALIPFAEVAPGWMHPLAGRTAAELAAKIKSGLTRLEVRVA